MIVRHGHEARVVADGCARLHRGTGRGVGIVHAERLRDALFQQILVVSPCFARQHLSQKAVAHARILVVGPGISRGDIGGQELI